MNTLVLGFIEVIDQAMEMLGKLTADEYKASAAPVVEFPIGSHFRHILDMFFAVRDGIKNGVIDYDKRRRGHPVETNIIIALEEFRELLNWANTITDDLLQKKIIIRSEAQISSKGIAEIDCNFGRELLFVSSHAVHHYAVIYAALKFLNIDVTNNFGYAPATVTFIKNK